MSLKHPKTVTEALAIMRTPGGQDSVDLPNDEAEKMPPTLPAGWDHLGPTGELTYYKRRGPMQEIVGPRKQDLPKKER